MKFQFNYRWEIRSAKRNVQTFRAQVVINVFLSSHPSFSGIFACCSVSSLPVSIGMDKLIIIEVQCGSYLGEDDIVRYDDVYGRITA